jgi:hypothetical protein
LNADIINKASITKVVLNKDIPQKIMVDGGIITQDDVDSLECGKISGQGRFDNTESV